MRIHNRKIECTFFCCFLWGLTWCQQIDATRFFSLNIQNLSTSGNLADEQLLPIPVGHNDANYLIDASLKFPIKLKGDFKMIGSLGYERESLYGLYEPSENEGEDINLHSVQSALILTHDFQSGSRLMARFKYESNSNRFLSQDSRATHMGASFLYEKPTQTGKFGYGLTVSKGQSLRILPLLVWEKDLGKGYALDLFIPSRILIKKRLNTRSQVLAGVKGEAARYFLDQSYGGGFNQSANYKRLTVQAIVGYERMLTSFLGFECSVGVNLPCVSGMYTYDKKWNQLHNFQDRITPRFRAGIFLAINRK